MERLKFNKHYLGKCYIEFYNKKHIDFNELITHLTNNLDYKDGRGGIESSEVKMFLICKGGYFFWSGFEPNENEGYINCKDNVEKFLALSALRDDTPIGSWYWFNDKLIKCEKLELKNLSFNTAQYLPKCRDVNNPMICFCADEKLLQKATIEEIVEHFK